MPACNQRWRPLWPTTRSDLQPLSVTLKARFKAFWTALLWLASSTPLLAQHVHPTPESPQDTAPGYRVLPYTAPTPGTYELPRVRPAADAPVVDDTGRATRLAELRQNKLTLLSFIYTHCADPNGCPLATFVMRQIARRAAELPTLRGRFALISVSFDLTHDTPARLANYAESFRTPAMNWHFVVPPTPKDLRRVLGAYGQAVLADPSGAVYSHQLRVFLVDTAGYIRNEYSTSFLHPDIVLADLQTIALEAPPTNATVEQTPSLIAGDDKRGYASEHYQTNSRALQARQGFALDLLAQLRSLPRGLPPLPTLTKLPTAAQVALGRRLFFDRRLSHNNTLACASCHIPEQGFAQQELATPVGSEGRTVKRNAPSLYNVVYQQRLFHDARESRLEQQIWSPLLATNEMANPSIGFVLDELSLTDDYVNAFKSAFPTGLTQESLGAALAAYQRTLVSGNSAFDRAVYGGESNALSAQAARGLELFRGKAGCARCHTIGPEHALFTDQALHNTGIGYARSMARPPPAAVQVAPGLSMPIDFKQVAASSEIPPNDLGRYEITLQPADRWRYKTPSLRNVARTAPYMHDGSLTTLAAVVDFYAAGGIPNEGLDPLLKPLELNADERAALVAFLQGLTGDNVDALARDAFAQPIGDQNSHDVD